MRVTMSKLLHCPGQTPVANPQRDRIRVKLFDECGVQLDR